MLKVEPVGKSLDETLKSEAKHRTEATLKVLDKRLARKHIIQRKVSLRKAMLS